MLQDILSSKKVNLFGEYHFISEAKDSSGSLKPLCMPEHSK